MKHSRIALLALGIMFVVPVHLRALPRFALMTGAKCGSCHVNPTGGQMRNEYGMSFSMEKLPLEATRDTEFSISTKINDNISVGGDYRSQFIYDAGTKSSSFQAMTTTLYGAVRVHPKITFYYKQDIINSAYQALSGPEVFVLARILPGGWYIKGGEFLPEYGWRLDDHTSYTRGGDLGFIASLGYQPGLLFIPNYKDIGVEVGGSAGDLLLTAGVFNGTGNTAPIGFSGDKAWVGKAEYAGSASDFHFRLGGSVYGFSDFKMYGVHSGFGIGSVVVTGELDWTRNVFSPFTNTITRGPRAMAAYAEADIQAVQGVWLTGKFDIFDPDQGVPDNEVKRITFGFEFFPYYYVEVRPQYRINLETPRIDNDQLVVQMHAWF
jgi:hypothetical protein